MNGHETTTFAIGNGMLALLQHPDQLARLRDDPGSSAPPSRRSFATTDRSRCAASPPATTSSRRRPRSERVRPSGSPSGRRAEIPRQFPEPNRLDIGRSPNRHLQFGLGPHFCIGAALARAEIQLALAGLLARFRRIELAADESDGTRSPSSAARKRCRSSPVRSAADQR